MCNIQISWMDVEMWKDLITYLSVLINTDIITKKIIALFTACLMLDSISTRSKLYFLFPSLTYVTWYQIIRKVLQRTVQEQLNIVGQQRQITITGNPGGITQSNLSEIGLISESIMYVHVYNKIQEIDTNIQGNVMSCQ